MPHALAVWASVCGCGPSVTPSEFSGGPARETACCLGSSLRFATCYLASAHLRVCPVLGTALPFTYRGLCQTLSAVGHKDSINKG